MRSSGIAVARVVNPIDWPAVQPYRVFWAGDSCLFMFVLLKPPSLIYNGERLGRKLRFHEQKRSHARRKRLHCRLYLDKLKRRVACLIEGRAVKAEELSTLFG